MAALFGSARIGQPWPGAGSSGSNRVR